MILNKTRRLLILVCMTGIFASCWDDFTERSYYTANVVDFSFAEQDTCPDIENYVFNIDQMKGLIYNLDSLPYGSKVDFICPTLTLQSSNGELYMNDSIWEEGDSVDFTSPVILKNTSADGLMTRTYTVNVNVHQVDPDSMIVAQYSNTFPTESTKSKLVRLTNGEFRCFFPSAASGLSAYISENSMADWQQQTVTGLPEMMNVQSLCVFDSKYYISSGAGNLYVSVNGLDWSLTGDGTKIVTLFGSIKRKYITEENLYYLIGLAKNASGEICPAKSVDGINWTIGSKLNDDFPVSEYGVAKGSTVTGVQYYTVATGLRSDDSYCSSIWSTENGLDWVLVRDSKSTSMPASNKKGVSLFYYDGSLVCLGGINSSGEFNKNIYVSKDHGKNWIAPPDNWIFYPLDNGLAYGSAYVELIEDTVNDKDREFIWIFGGQTEAGTSPVIWKSYLNKMIFARR